MASYTATMAENCINCVSARPTPPSQTLWSWALKTLFWLKTEKPQTIRDFRPPKKGRVMFTTFLHPTPTPPQPPSKWVSSGGGLGGSRTKTHWGMRSLDNILILQRVKPTSQPLGVSSESVACTLLPMAPPCLLSGPGGGGVAQSSRTTRRWSLSLLHMCTGTQGAVPTALVPSLIPTIAPCSSGCLSPFPPIFPHHSPPISPSFSPIYPPHFLP